MTNESFSKEYTEYWESVSKSLTNYVESKRVIEVEQLINSVLAFLCFSSEDLKTKSTKNQGDLNKLNIYVLLAIDSMRSLLRCQEELSLIGIALIQRTAFEIHCNLLYMFKHSNPSQMIDRNHRYNDVEKFKQSKQSTNILISAAEETAIKRRCSEWFDATGNLKKNPHWTAEPGKNLREIAKAIGNEDMYISLYPTSSKFVHGSNAVANLYKDNMGQLHFNGKPETCARMSILACKFWMDSFEAYFDYFGIQPSDVDFRLTKQNLAVSMSKYTQ